MTQKIEQSQRQDRVATWSRHAESELSAYQSTAKVELQAQKPRDKKLCANLEDAIRRSGLQDGMTISFHHAFRGGDLTINLVMDAIARMGFKNLTLASSSLSALLISERFIIPLRQAEGDLRQAEARYHQAHQKQISLRAGSGRAHRPVSRHDLPPHELARVRRVHPRGQAEPARLQP